MAAAPCPPDVPALYGSRTLLVDARNQHIGYSPLFERTPNFRNALVQSIAGGNTMVFNRAARDLLRQAGENVTAVTHDWWAYMLVTGCGGACTTTPIPPCATGSTATTSSAPTSACGHIWSGHSALLRGRFRGWVDANVRALQGVRHLMTPENQQRARRIRRARASAGWCHAWPGCGAPASFARPAWAIWACIAAALINRL